MKLAWGTKVSFEFRRRVLGMAMRLHYPDPSHFMACFGFETGGTFSPSVRNPYSNFVGLIQFGKDAAEELGTTQDKLAAMTAEEQLEYVERYFARRVAAFGPLRDLADVYMAIFWPKAIGKPWDYQLITDPESKAYVQNKGLDLNKDGNITKGEATTQVKGWLDRGLANGNATEEREPREGLAAPIEERSIEGGGMDAVDTVAGLASIFNPAAGGALGLAGQLLKAIGPLVQAKVVKAVGKHTDPDTAAEVAQNLATMVVGQAQALTGETDPFRAVAAAVTKPESGALAAIEKQVDAAAVQMLSDLGDKSSGWDQAYWRAQNEGRQTVSTIAIAEKKAGLWDMTRTLVYAGAIITTVGSFALLGAIITQSMAWVFQKDAKGVDPVLLALAGPLLTICFQCWKDVIAYRFDGTKDSSAQTQAAYDAIARNK